MVVQCMEKDKGRKDTSLGIEVFLSMTEMQTRAMPPASRVIYTNPSVASRILESECKLLNVVQQNEPNCSTSATTSESARVKE